MIETDELEKKQKEIVRAQIVNIVGLINDGRVGMLSHFGFRFGSTILENLPPRVQTFGFSNAYPFIYATREDDSGTEYWSGKQAYEWATGDSSDTGSESIRSEIEVVK